MAAVEGELPNDDDCRSRRFPLCGPGSPEDYAVIMGRMTKITGLRRTNVDFRRRAARGSG